MLSFRPVWLGITFLILSVHYYEHLRLHSLPSNKGSCPISRCVQISRPSLVVSEEENSDDVKAFLNIQYYYPQQYPPYPQQYYPPPPGYSYQRPPYEGYQPPSPQTRATFCATQAGPCQLAPNLVLPRGIQCSCGFANGVFFGIAE